MVPETHRHMTNPSIQSPSPHGLQEEHHRGDQIQDLPPNVNLVDIREGMDSAIKFREANQYPTEFYKLLIRATLEKILNGKAKPLSEQSHPTNTMSTMVILQYRNNKSDQFSKKLRRTANVSVSFITRKLESFQPPPPRKARPENVAE